MAMIRLRQKTVEELQRFIEAKHRRIEDNNQKITEHNRASDLLRYDNQRAEERIERYREEIQKRTAQPTAPVSRFNMSPSQVAYDPVVTIKTLVPYGQRIYALIRGFDNGKRMRLYAIQQGNGLFAFDHLITEALFFRILDTIQDLEADLVTYCGFEYADAHDGPGFGWPDSARINLPLLIVYGLAEIVHGNRRAWSLTIL